MVKKWLKRGGLLYLRGGCEGRVRVAWRSLYSIFNEGRGLLYFSGHCFAQIFAITEHYLSPTNNTNFHKYFSPTDCTDCTDNKPLRPTDTSPNSGEELNKSHRFFRYAQDSCSARQLEQALLLLLIARILRCAYFFLSLLKSLYWTAVN